MSPTKAMLMRSDDLSGGGIAAGAGSASTGLGAGTGAEIGSGAVFGSVVQPAVNSSRSANAVLVILVTEPNAHYIDFRRPEPATSNVQFFQVVDRPDVDTKIVAVINACALDTRFNAMQCEFSASSVRVDMRRKRTGL